MHDHTVAYLTDLATRVFGDRAKAEHWLNRPSVQLGGRTPMEMLASDAGARRVEELLAQVDDDDRHRAR
jgi:putative toxin-antitoxin system antitoxin component (TIGR02293 family)